MTVIGTGTTAGVAQTGLTAQQTSRAKDRIKNRRAAEARDLREDLDSHIQAIDEGDGDGNPLQLHIDDQLPDHQTPQQVQSVKHQPVERLDGVDNESPPPEHGAPPRDGDLYHHVDLQA